MSEKLPPPGLGETAGVLNSLIRQVRLVWRLLHDGRVSGWVKLLPVAGILYLLSPVDLMPDITFPGLGELDDLAVILLALKAFIDLSPPGVVREHLEALMGRRGQRRSADDLSADSCIDGTYRVLDKNEKSKGEP